ncbi:hypothetical protein SDC9_153593 [bioreactor metagenome]|uniref:Uncharacterized protein n=1 Tax=bioreactor metagenome TaxID=1076179 RepID=A0A645EWT1_9ZZZZ
MRFEYKWARLNNHVKAVYEWDNPDKTTIIQQPSNYVKTFKRHPTQRISIFLGIRFVSKNQILQIGYQAETKYYNTS